MWIFYAIYFSNIHYVNAYNEWILPLIFIYFVYSIILILSFSHFNGFYHRTSFFLILCAIFCFAVLCILILFILVKNKHNSLNKFSFFSFYGNSMIHCFD